MIANSRTLLALLTFGLGVVACSGSVAGGGNGGDGGGGSSSGGDASPGGPACAPTTHRAAPKTCALSSAPSLGDGAAPPTCATDTDCATSGSGYSYCRAGVCSFDECLSDGDCTSAEVCVCSTDYYGGNAAYHPNLCVPATCHVDADCGANGVCAESVGYCGTPASYHCGKSTDVSCGSATTCSYSDQDSEFVCVAATACSG